MRHWRITGNSNVTIHTASIYISDSMTDQCNFDGKYDHAQNEETDSGRLRQRPTTGNSNIDVLGVNLAISGIRSLSLSFSNLLSISSSSKIPNLALEFRRYLSEFQRCNYFRFWGAISIFPVVGRCCTYLPTLFYTFTWSYTFAAAAPAVWNSLPEDVRSSTSLPVFRRRLKDRALQTLTRP